MVILSTCLKKNYLIFLEDNEKFTESYKKIFPILYYFLPIFHVLSFTAILYSTKFLAIDYLMALASLLDPERVNSDSFSLDETYKEHLNFLYVTICIYLCSVLLAFGISLYLIYRTDSQIQYRLLQSIRHGGRALAAATGGLLMHSHNGWDQPSVVSNFIHTKTPLGRGFDFEAGSMLSKIKGELVIAGLGGDMVLKAVEKYASPSKILNSEVLLSIFNDSEYAAKLRKSLTVSEMRTIGLPLFDSGTGINLTGKK